MQIIRFIDRFAALQSLLSIQYVRLHHWILSNSSNRSHLNRSWCEIIGKGIFWFSKKIKSKQNFSFGCLTQIHFILTQILSIYEKPINEKI